MAWTALLMVALLTLTEISFASRSNTGTEFIIGFMNNDLQTQVGLEIFVTTMSNTPADVTITTPLYNSGWSETATIARQEVKLIIVPYQLRVDSVGKSNKGVSVVATQPITVYCVNKEQYTTDAYVALPVNVVGQEYYAMTYIANAQILLIGTQAGTSCSVKLSDNSRSGSGMSVTNVNINYNNRNYGNGQTMTFTIGKYETFFITQYLDYSSDLTGSYITSNKPVSCLTGNFRSWIPAGTQSSDHLTEQLPSVDTWGKEFVTTSTPDRGIGDLFRVVASEDSTFVNFGNGVHTKTLAKAGDFWELDIATGSYMTVVADKPIQIGLFSKTFQNDGPHYGDPAMSLLVPTVQYASEYTWSTTNLPNGNPFNDKISIIIDKTKKSGLLLDGSAISSSWESVTGSNKWQQTWLRIQPGSHNLYHNDPTVTFMALATGTENFNSYAFSAGTRLATINAPCSPTTAVAGDTVDNDCDGVVDEETLDNIDNDGDGLIDEDLALPPRVDGAWSSWTGWGACSVSCGAQGTKVQTRACNDPAPQNNGLDCVGNSQQSQTCDMRSTPCPVNGGWTSYSSWGACSVTCGTGTKTKTRTCTNPTPAHGGSQCTGQSSQSQSCNTGISCAVNGGWGTWGGWGSCSVTCATGSKERTRACDRPAPLNGGNQCPGSNTDTTSCTMVPCPIDGEWGTWATWSVCSVTCGGVGVKERTRSCDNPAPQHLGADCVGSDTSTDSCDSSKTLCSSGNVWAVLTFTTTAGAPVDGGLSPWSDWGQCTSQCGRGVRTRQRFCNDPKPQWGGSDCTPGPFVEEEVCNTHACTPTGYAHGVSHGGTCVGKRGNFDCRNGYQCVSILKKCDCKADCFDGSDEEIDYAGCLIELSDCTNGGDCAKFALLPAFILALCTVILNLIGMM